MSRAMKFADVDFQDEVLLAFYASISPFATNMVLLLLLVSKGFGIGFMLRLKSTSTVAIWDFVSHIVAKYFVTCHIMLC